MELGVSTDAMTWRIVQKEMLVEPVASFIQQNWVHLLMMSVLSDYLLEPSWRVKKWNHPKGWQPTYLIILRRWNVKYKNSKTENIKNHASQLPIAGNRVSCMKRGCKNQNWISRTIQKTISDSVIIARKEYARVSADQSCSHLSRYKHRSKKASLYCLPDKVQPAWRC